VPLALNPVITLARQTLPIYLEETFLKVFVLDTNKRQLEPVHPAEARLLLREQKAAVFRKYPFTIILKEESRQQPEPLRLKIDPGSRTTGIVLLKDSGEIVFAMELAHRGLRIKKLLDSRRASRSSRRSRKTRYRKPRFENRSRPKGWLPPSLKSRVYNIETWVQRLQALSNVQSLSMELVKFDSQLMQDPEISGVQYQQGQLAGYEVREYLLEKWNRTCAYCGKTDVPLEIEHIVPRSRGGSDRVSNLTLACNRCNQLKNNQPVELFLHSKPELLARILRKARAPLRDAAAVNATRWYLYHRLQQYSLPVEVGSGGLTKFNRRYRNLPKTHWLDAACVGRSTPLDLFQSHNQVLQVQAMGHGCRQMCRPDKYGFPRTGSKSTVKKVRGFQTGDIVRAVVTSGRKIGCYTGRVAVRASGSFNIKTETETAQGISWKYCSLQHAADGYSYTY
jgi:5-methylcytosine-specific restriction endonuclease McrA